MNETRYCICCSVKMESVFDADPDGSMGVVCARCSAEVEHDYDLEPDAEFNRAGRRVDEKAIKNKLKFLEELEDYPTEYQNQWIGTEKPIECVVQYCDNNSNGGVFYGNLCGPCHEYVTSGRGIYSQAFRNTQAEVLKEREACASIVDNWIGQENLAHEIRARSEK
jgi:hypothetical protein